MRTIEIIVVVIFTLMAVSFSVWLLISTNKKTNKRAEEMIKTLDEDFDYIKKTIKYLEEKEKEMVNK